MSEFRFGDNVEVFEGCIKSSFDNSPHPLTYRGEAIVSPAFCRVESADGVYHFVPVAWLYPAPTTTPAEQAVYDRIEHVLEALADGYQLNGGLDTAIAESLRCRDGEYLVSQVLPAFAALLEAEFTED